MTYRESIKGGFEIINRNWQLVLIQIAAMFLSFVGFFILVGFPLALAFIVFGLDLTELSRVRDLLGAFHSPSEIISRYFGLAVLVLTCILLYLLVVLSMGIFIFGGAIGVIGRSIRRPFESFRMKEFLSEGRRLFLPLVGFTTAIGLVFIALAFVLGLFGGVIAAIVSAAREHEATLALFFGIFFSLVLFLFGAILILVTLAVTLYGAAALTLRGFGPLAAMRESTRHLLKHGGAFTLYCIVFGGYILINFVFLFLGYPLKFIPVVGPLIAVVLQFFVHVIQS